ncbi:unnamed protein product [Mytilus edulis]|uniref:Uncharacterized protein n=1 Tax=Mytilus edulis TaxID=6550 RepID=A0A8S3SB25_MYTED|nr:unnamed protein product [Mytilus edulis]
MLTAGHPQTHKKTLKKADSVLSKVMSSVIDQNEAEYIIYSSDLINVKNIAGKTSIPTYSRWMHGILGTVSSWDSGFWILHNNLLFPAIQNGILAVPGSKAWYATTVRDSSADIFYICLTADTQGNITEMLTSIMAGNPFIYKRKLRSYNFIQPYFKEVRPLQTSFGYEMSASIFLICAKLPNVHMNVIKSAKLSQWPCRNRNSHQKRSNLYNQGKAKHSTHMVTNVKQTDLFPTRKGNNDDENNNVLISDATKDSDEKDAAKFCLMYDCDKNEDVQKEQEQFDISHSKNSLLKNPKTEDLFSKMVTDITMKHTIKNPRKIHKTDIKKKKGCRFCQNAKEQFILLANSIQTEYLDFVIVDINEPSLPDDLQVPFTPYVRFSTDEYVLSDAKKGKDSLLTKYEISERKRRDTRDILKGTYTSLELQHIKC